MTLGRWLVLFAPSDAVIRLVLRVTRQRLTHLAALEAAGRPGYPVGHRTSVWLSSLKPGAAGADGRPVAGRVRRIRDHGGVCFAALTDHGVNLQLLLAAQTLGLSTCWTALTFSKRQVRRLAGPEERLVCALALGYGATQMVAGVTPGKGGSTWEGTLPDGRKALLPVFDTVNDAVKAYGVGRTTLYALIKQGELPDVKVCGRRVIPVEAVLNGTDDPRMEGLDFDSPAPSENAYMKRYSVANYAHRMRAGLAR